MELPIHSDAGFSIACLTDYLDLRITREDRLQRHAGEEVVFYQEDTDLFHALTHRIGGYWLAGIDGCIAWTGTRTVISVPAPIWVCRRKVPPSLRVRSSITRIPKCPLRDPLPLGVPKAPAIVVDREA